MSRIEPSRPRVPSVFARVRNLSGPPAPTPDREDRHVAAIVARATRGASDVKRRPPGWLAAMGVVLAAAAASLLAIRSEAPVPGSAVESRPARISWLEGPTKVVHDGQPRVIRAGGVLALHDHVEVKRGGRLGIELGSGARVELRDEVTLRLERADSQHERLALDRGLVALRVPKLGKGATLVVQTKDAEVRVVGTRFSVVALSQQTCVFVEEGVVSVAPAAKGAVTLLRSNQRWTSDGRTCQVRGPSSAPVSSEAVTLGSASPVGPAPHQEAAPTRHSPANAGPSSALRRGTLPEENELLLRAIRARQEGKLDEARGALEEFSRRFPSSTLMKVVASERRRLAESKND